jgi:hypothetical protein
MRPKGCLFTPAIFVLFGSGVLIWSFVRPIQVDVGTRYLNFGKFPVSQVPPSGWNNGEPVFKAPLPVEGHAYYLLMSVKYAEEP